MKHICMAVRWKSKVSIYYQYFFSIFKNARVSQHSSLEQIFVSYHTVVVVVLVVYHVSENLTGIPYGGFLLRSGKQKL